MEGRNILAKANLSQLAIIDVQIKLAPVMQVDAMQMALKNIGILVQAANFLQVPIVVTEQYPQGLGSTVPEIAQLIQKMKPIEKTVFSACKAPKFNQQCVKEKSQIILTGMEAHICILQTAMDLLKANKQVFVVEDAVISRNSVNKANAIARMRDAGCIITNTESVVFEWLGRAEGDVFKAISKLIR